MELKKTRRVFRFLANVFAEPGWAGAPAIGRILAALKEDPYYKDELKDISPEDLDKEISGRSILEIAGAIKEAVEDYYNEQLQLVGHEE